MRDSISLDRRELEEIRAASGASIRTTPLLDFTELSRRSGGEIAIKAENLQLTGSFKLRGALAKMRAAGGDTSRGVVTGSAGNHAQALAYAAQITRLPCTVFMPRSAPVSKLDAVTALGAVVHQEGDSVDDCVAAARELAARRGLLFVHPFDDIEVVKGQAGLGLEMLEQAHDLSQVIVPVGGGGLISGIAGALRIARPGVRIVGVQARGCASFEASLRAGEPVACESPSTIADGIAVKRPGELTLPLVERWVDDLVTVDDETIAEAMVMLADRAKLVVEGAGAVGVAALLAGASVPAPKGTTVIVLSGGNVDANLLTALINRHQTGVGRRTRFSARVPDRPGGLVGLLGAVAGGGGNVLEVTHVRDGVPLQVGEVDLEVVVETRSSIHRDRLLQSIREAGIPVDEDRLHPSARA
jgi:threonine dehydratase